MAVTIALASAAPAMATDYTVSGTADPAGVACGPVTNGAATCPSLRAAISRASQDAVTDRIFVPSGVTQLTAGALPVNTNMSIIGAGAGATTIDAGGKSRVMTIAFQQTPLNVTLNGLTLSGGSSVTATSGPGGNLATTNATVVLDHVRLTNGAGYNGGGLAMSGGSVTLTHSLVDTNKSQQQAGTGGLGAGIYMSQTAAGTTGVPTKLTVTDSTITGNLAAADGGGIYVVGSVTANSTAVTRSTIANNSANGTGAGIVVADAEPFDLGSSIVSRNLNTSGRIAVVSNCSGKVTSLGANVASTTDCALTAAGDVQGVDPLLGPLADAGGQLPVLPLTAGSPAIDRAGACTGTDQRDVARPQGAACDSGAYEFVPPVVQPAPTPTPTPIPPPPAIPKPVFHKTVVVVPVSGKVKIKLKGSNKFVTLTSADDIPLGSTIDVKNGKIRLQSVPKKDGTVADRDVLRRHLQGHAERRDHRPAADRGPRALHQSRPRLGRRGQEEEAQDPAPVGEREGRVPHHRPLQRRHRAGDGMARPGLLLRNADAGQARRGERARHRAPQDDRRARRAPLHGQAQEEEVGPCGGSGCRCWSRRSCSPRRPRRTRCSPRRR